MYIKCSSNDCAATVIDAFLEGVSNFGNPSCVRFDHGGENVEYGGICLSNTTMHHV